MLSYDLMSRSTRHSREDNLYEPVRRALQQRFERYGTCELHVTARGLSNRVKEFLDDASLYYARVEKTLPDLMGNFTPTPNTKLPYFIRGGLIVAEVKPGPPKLRHILQAKMYLEVFDSWNAFLICDTDTPPELDRFLKKRSSLLSTHAGYSALHIGVFDLSSNNFIKWHPRDPFSKE